MTSSCLGSAAGSVEVPNRFLAAPVGAAVGGAENSENAGFSSGDFLSEARLKVNEDFWLAVSSWEVFREKPPVAGLAAVKVKGSGKEKK